MIRPGLICPKGFFGELINGGGKGGGSRMEHFTFQKYLEGNLRLKNFRGGGWAIFLSNNFFIYRVVQELFFFSLAGSIFFFLLVHCA